MAGGNAPVKGKTAGVVLAGGQSSRMGRDKAALPFRGRPMIDHMIGLLRASGCDDIFVSGQREGYDCIPDSAPHQGPAAAMRQVLHALRGYRGVLFVPVDMPLLTPDFLRRLLAEENGAFFDGWPLPAYIAAAPHIQSEATSVHAFLDELGIRPIPHPERAEERLVNLNTPDEWLKATGKT